MKNWTGPKLGLAKPSIPKNPRPKPTTTTRPEPENETSRAESETEPAGRTGGRARARVVFDVSLLDIIV